MGEFREANGWVFITDLDVEYMANLENFRADCEWAKLPAYQGLPTDPPGILSRRYVQGKLHAFCTADNCHGGPLPWPKGDRYIRAIFKLLGATHERKTIPPVRDQADAGLPEPARRRGRGKAAAGNRADGK